MSTQKNIQGYNDWSNFYDEYPNPTVAIDELSFPQVYSEIIGQKVLEIGCGTGRHTRRLIGAGHSVVALDISEGMLAKARKKLESDRTGRIYFSEIHPLRTQSGIMAHFKKENGEDFHLESRPHAEAEIKAAAESAGFHLQILNSVKGNQKLADLNSKWLKYLNQPMIQIWVFEKRI